MKTNEVKELAKQLRKEILESSYATGKIGVHIGPALSCADYLAYLYGKQMNVSPEKVSDENRDRFILSKGHAYTALYSILSLQGFFSQEEYRVNFMTDGGLYPAHPIKQLQKGIECSSGSLGMGISFAVGKSLAAKKKGLSYKTYVVMGDGECNEGSTFEAFTSAAQFKLDNLVVFIDHNGYQQDGTTNDVMNIPFFSMFQSLGWDVVEIDGNNIYEIDKAFANRKENTGKPFAIIGKTVKGKGVSFMEGINSWHHASMKEEQYIQALGELK